MKLFGLKKGKKAKSSSDNEALDELIDDMPAQHSDDTGAPTATAAPVNTDTPNTLQDNSATSDDFLTSLDKKPKAFNSNILKWVLIALSVLLAIMVLYFLYSTFIADDTESNLTDTALPTLSEGAEPAPVLETEQTLEAQTLDVDGTDTDTDIDTDSNLDTDTDAVIDTSELTTQEGDDLEINTLTDIPDPEEIISAELPKTEVMAKEEIDRLADEAAQLEEQGELIADQVAMMDELTDKKAEQIELLEQQIALLEAQKNSQ